jgi:hypothetical protein
MPKCSLRRAKIWRDESGIAPFQYKTLRSVGTPNPTRRVNHLAPGPQLSSDPTNHANQPNHFNSISELWFRKKPRQPKVSPNHNSTRACSALNADVCGRKKKAAQPIA